VRAAVKKVQQQMGNFGGATDAVDALMADFKGANASAQSSGADSWRGAFGEAGMAAPDFAQMYDGLKKRRLNPKVAGNEGVAEEDEDDSSDPDGEKPPPNDEAAKPLNDVKRNKAERAFRTSVDDLKQQVLVVSGIGVVDGRVCRQ
jgi:hypothetical protein